ncbi:MAG: hypothetical protein ACPGO3_08660 [Magnetospiraceae bacterium]
MSMDQTLDALIETVDRLSDMLERENIALARRDGAGVRALIEEKLTLTRAYETAFAAMSDSKSDLGTADPTLVAEMKDAGFRLDRLMAENGRLLMVAVRTGQTFMNIVATAAQQHRPRTGAYGANGKVDAGAAGASLALNTAL